MKVTKTDYNTIMNFKSFFLLIISIPLIVTPTSYAAAAQPQLASFYIKAEGATVYDENGNGKADLLGDTWVYDTNSDGRAELIIRFRQEQTLNAYVYDDSDNDGRVDYAIGTDGITILEPHWRVKVSARENRWLLPDGQPDWNLDSVFDSGFYAASEIPAIPRKTCWNTDQTGPAFALPDSYTRADNHIIKIDGTPDFGISYWDLNDDGVPDLEWQKGVAAGSTDSMFVNLNSDWQVQVTHQFPMLGTVFFMNWGNARIQNVRFLVPAYLNSAGYNLINIHPPIVSGHPAYAFEDPFALYNMRDKQSCTSNLKIRLVSDAPDEDHPSATYYEEARYSWAQLTDSIQYRLYLVGKVLSTNAVNYPPYPVNQIPYRDLPGFVLTNVWQGAAFAEYEATTPGSFVEGIYENIFYTPRLRSVLLSHLQVALPNYFPAFLQLREEYDLTGFNRAPRLYYNPIDRRLHLLGARQGIIIYSADTSNAQNGFDFGAEELANGTMKLNTWTTYADSDGDGYIDTWTYYENGNSVAQLVYRNGIVLLAANNSVSIKVLPSGLGVSAWEAPPPSTQTDWKIYNDRLSTVLSRRPLSDLAGIFSDLPGEGILLKDTRLLKVSSQKRDLIAEIDTLGLSIPASASDNLAGKTLAAGQYILRISSGRLQLDIARSVSLQLSALSLVESTENVKGAGITFNVSNPGLTDTDAHLILSDQLKGGRVILLDESILVPALGEKDFDVYWLPATPGEHQLEAQLLYSPSDGSPSEKLVQKITLEDNLPALQKSVFFSTNTNIIVSILLACLLIIILVGGSINLIRYASNDESII
jgi:hypothetical protein